MDIDIRPAARADVPGLVALSAALFAEDGAIRDRLRSAGWPRADPLWRSGCAVCLVVWQRACHGT
jgi:hypothetical protein